MKMSTRNARRLITRFEKAVVDHAFLGTIPVRGQDAQEQRDIDKARGDILRRYDLAKKALTRFCDEAIIGDG